MDSTKNASESPGSFNGRPVQGSLFEEDYLLRTLGAVVTSPDIAMAELVANAWDAGASIVKIFIPEEDAEQLTIEDDGCGMTSDQFRKRWMTLGYNRIKHQGKSAEFPPERSNWRRQAYGRNGVGRHALLCFADRYEVETRQDGKGVKFVVTTSSGRDPFVLNSEEKFELKGHGTRLTSYVDRNLPSLNKIRDMLSARFLHDPQFTITVNGKSVPLAEHTGLIDQKVLKVTEDVKVEAFFIDLKKAVRRTLHQGVAFWIGGRLVGEPSWSLRDRVLIDGRTRLAKRHAVVVKSNDLFDDVIPDWSAFKNSRTVELLYEAVAEYVEGMFRIVASEQIEDTKEAVLREHHDEIISLQPLAKIEVSEFVDELASKHLTMQQETISVAVKAVIQIEKSRSGTSLLEKLSKLTEEDVEGLDHLLSEWTIRDALTVLDEIDRRIAVIEALGKLSADSKIDELHTLHPLVTQARWLFGPEFDSPEYASNVSLITAVEKVFKKQVDKEAFLNYRNRPDLVVLSDATISVVATEQFDETSSLSTMRDILIIELKRGRSRVGRTEINQASGYVEDLLNCGVLDGNPFISAFVVAHEIQEKVQPVRKVGEKPELGRIQACTYGQLIRTAEKRLFRLKERLKNRYEEVSGTDLLRRILDEPKQIPFTMNE